MKKIYLASPHMSEEKYEEKYVKEAFDTNWTPIALKRSQSSCDEWLGITIPLVTITRGASLCEGNSPSG